MLRIKNLCKTIGSAPIFTDVDLNITENSFTVLVGPSGCGKTTFFHSIVGLCDADKGLIEYRGKTTKNLLTQAAYMQQKDLLLPWLSLFDNVMLPALSKNDKSAKTIQQAKSYLKDFCLEEYQTYLPSQVSGGMRQRCALARTLMFNRDIIFLDEPLSALDAITRHSMQKMLLSLQVEYGKTIVMITHDIEEALLLADDLYIMSKVPMNIIKKHELRTTKPRTFDAKEVIEGKIELTKLLSEEQR